MTKCPECDRDVPRDANGLFAYHDYIPPARELCYGSKLDLDWRDKGLDGKLRWFGRNWGAPICEPELHVPTPVKMFCVDCDETIERGDQGVLIWHIGKDANEYRPFHYYCYFRQIIGGVNHQKGTCICCGGTEDPDPPELTRREAAKIAYEYFEEHHVNVK